MAEDNGVRKYNQLSEEVQHRILEDRKNGWVNPYACRDEDVIRKYEGHDKASLWRPAFVRDCEKIMHNPYYNRYSDKTQVFSLLRNDDVSRRAQHVQLVSRIARNIGKALGLNIDLIEAVSLGHDIGHTPFGHAGERKLSELYYGHTGRYFNHNIQSARIFTTLFPMNVSLQTLDGIICHNGEMEMERYSPKPYSDFAVFEDKMESAYRSQDALKSFVPATLEGCVMRVSDIIAYLGKDRQDALRIGLMENDNAFDDDVIGRTNAEIINNICVDIIENSYGKSYLSMSEPVYRALSAGKKKNGREIYANEKVNEMFDDGIYPMFEDIYGRLLEDLEKHNDASVIFRHHLKDVNGYACFYNKKLSEDEKIYYEKEEKNAIVVDFIASMTDDYFIDLHEYLFPDSRYRVTYRGYFDGMG